MSDEPPRLFVSYSWSGTGHENWVIKLATDLREVGIDVILDKWDLKEGNDAYAFMERMVTDPSIRKVILVCDQNYSEKANARAGSVGTETQIITALWRKHTTPWMTSWRPAADNHPDLIEIGEHHGGDPCRFGVG